MALRRVTPQSRADAVIEALAAYVEAAGLRPGDRFPSERELAEKLGVSRPILREGLRHLAALRVTESRTGSGTYLLKPLSPSDRHIVLQLESERQGLLQVLQLRRALESEAAALVALYGSERTSRSSRTSSTASSPTSSSSATTPRPTRRSISRSTGSPATLSCGNSWSRSGRPSSASGSIRSERRPSLAAASRFIGASLTRIRARDPQAARQLVVQMLDIVEEDLRA